MPRELSAYHRRVAASNRAAILDAARHLFLQSGYDRTSLAKVAEAAGVSTATLFKQFPTKAELFESTLLNAAGTPDGEFPEPTPTDFHADLVQLGGAYAELLCRPGIDDLIRTVIAEAPRFPELRARTFDFGTLPVIAAVGRYLRAAHAAGIAVVDDPDTAASQFLGMISTVVFWPRFVHGGWSLTEAEIAHVVDEAARTMAARHARSATG